MRVVVSYSTVLTASWAGQTLGLPLHSPLESRQSVIGQVKQITWPMFADYHFRPSETARSGGAAADAAQAPIL